MDCKAFGQNHHKGRKRIQTHQLFPNRFHDSAAEGQNTQGNAQAAHHQSTENGQLPGSHKDSGYIGNIVGAQGVSSIGSGNNQSQTQQDVGFEQIDSAAVK